MSGYSRHPASFKDPSGFIFQSSSIHYRQVNKCYAPHYNQLMQSGLYHELVKKNMLLPHTEIKENWLDDEEWYLTLMPEQIPFWSYPYEWCFEQLKDAALLTLAIAISSLEYGMSLKDATPYNIQFHKGKPVFIDTLSFERYDETQPWIAYRQFCENFLYPLWLAHLYKLDCHPLMSAYPEGIPAPAVARLFPATCRLHLSAWLHVYLPAKMSQASVQRKPISRFSKKKLLNILSHLHALISKFNNHANTTWHHYYRDSVNETYIREKEKIVLEMLKHVQGNQLLDLGANDGYFSRLAAGQNFSVLAVDNDEQCINNLYRKIQTEADSRILPLCFDVTNPPAASGFANQERSSFNERIKADAVLALALVHHLHIGKNIPLSYLADYFNRLAPYLIIEFVPKEDEKVQCLLQYKKDIYSAYSKEMFEKLFGKHFSIRSAHGIPGTQRSLYLMVRK